MQTETQKIQAFLTSAIERKAICDEVASGSEYMNGVRFGIGLIIADLKSFFYEEFHKQQNGDTIPNFIDNHIVSDANGNHTSNNTEVTGEVSHA